MFKKAQTQSIFSIIAIILIFIIILAGGLATFLGQSSEVMGQTATSGYVGWFFNNWLFMTFIVFILWIGYSIFRG